MGANYAQAVANGETNLWGDALIFMEPESEHSSASAAEGFALAGGRVTNFTSGQGLILMKEVLYVISGKRLPVVFHIGARALTSHSLNVHAGHDDVMGVADTGWGMLFAKNAQGAGDLALISRRAAEDSVTPFLNVQDGFLTTHTIENVLLPEPELMKQYIGNPPRKLRNLMDPRSPVMSGVVQNQDSYMKGKIAQRYFYDRVKPVVEEAMDEFYDLTGRRYDLVEPYRMEDAEYAIVCMGSMAETAAVTCDYLREETGLKVGVVHVTCFPALPRSRAGRASLSGLKAVHRARAHGRPHGPEQPADRGDQGRVRRRPERRARLSARPSPADHLQRLGGPGQPRCAPRRLHRCCQEHGRRRAALLRVGHQARTGPAERLRP